MKEKQKEEQKGMSPEQHLSPWREVGNRDPVFGQEVRQSDTCRHGGKRSYRDYVFGD